MEFHVYTDGSCKGNPGKGGYAYTVYDQNGESWIVGHGSARETTNNKMELTAAIEAIRAIKNKHQNFTIKIHSDSAYLVNCFVENWIENWNKNGWKTSDGKDVLNREYWETLDSLVKSTNATFEKVSRNDLRIKQVDREAKLATKSL